MYRIRTPYKNVVLYPSPDDSPAYVRLNSYADVYYSLVKRLSSDIRSDNNPIRSNAFNPVLRSMGANGNIYLSEIRDSLDWVQLTVEPNA